jgi:hypothetical protein
MTDVVNVRCKGCGRWLIKVDPRTRRVVRARGDKVVFAQVAPPRRGGKPPLPLPEVDPAEPLPTNVSLTCPRCGEQTQPFTR